VFLVSVITRVGFTALMPLISVLHSISLTVVDPMQDSITPRKTPNTTNRKAITDKGNNSHSLVVTLGITLIFLPSFCKFDLYLKLQYIKDIYAKLNFAKA
jgi:hypothetical protein